MATYGKKKRSLLQSFSEFRDAVTTPKQKKASITRASSAFNIVVSNKDESLRDDNPRHNDSLGELPNRLLDDTINESNAQTPPLPSGVPSAQTMPNLSGSTTYDKKSLPQLPRLLFNGDDAWAMRVAPVVRAAGYSNEVQFDSELDELNRTPSLFEQKLQSHVRKDSGPPIPRRSSKRKSGRPSRNVILKENAEGEHHGRPEPRLISATNTTSDGTALNEKIDAMLAATKTLKGDSNSLFLGPLVQPKKRRIMDNVVLTRMKSAIHDRLSIIGSRKCHDPARDDHLLNDSLNELPDYEEDTTTLSNMEIRMNEGENFKNPKLSKLTGHGAIPRKPLADDGKSLRSRKSVDEPFTERPNSSCRIRTPNGIHNRLRGDLPVNLNMDIPDLPSRQPTPNSSLNTTKSKKLSVAYDGQSGQYSNDILPFETDKQLVHSSEAETNLLHEQSNRVSTPPHQMQKTMSANQNHAPYDTDLESLFSSSPLAQSTPRIRLEPMEKDGKRTLKSVPASSRSLFDTGMDVDIGAVATTSDSKRKSFQVRELGIHPGSESVKRTKKHPSPSKAELEGWGDLMKHYSSFKRSESFIMQDDKANIGKNNPSSAALAGKDPNARLLAKNVRRCGKSTEALQKVDLVRNSESMPAIPSRTIWKSATQICETQEDRRYSSRGALISNSMMDIDELQWEHTRYNIGTKKG